MSRDDYYARVDRITDQALETLSVLTPSLTDFIFASHEAIREAGEQHLAPEERTGITNLSFFYLLATCIDFLFFLHLRHRHVTLYQHELEHIFGVLLSHAQKQEEALKAPHAHGEHAEPHLHPHPPGQEPPPLDWAAFEREISRYREKLERGE